jgi:hypothetical protein
MDTKNSHYKDKDHQIAIIKSRSSNSHYKAIQPLYMTGVSMGRIGSEHYYFIFFLPDSNPTRLRSDKKILTHTRSDRVIGRPDPCKIIKYLIIIFK